MKKTAITILLFNCILFSKAQNVGIGTSTPQQKLHVAGAGQTIRIDGLSGVGTRSVYVTPLGDLTFTPASLAPEWLTVGNGGTSAGTNFIGTTDGVDFVTKTTGTERTRISGAGQFNVNNATFLTNDVFAVFGNGIAGTINSTNNFAINGYVNSLSGIGVYGENASGIGMYGASAVTGIYGRIISTGLSSSNTLWGDNLGVGVAIRGQAVNASGGIGVLGFTAVQAGLHGQASGTGDGIRGISTSTVVNAGDGIYGQGAYGGWASFASIGVEGYNSSSTGVAVFGSVGAVGGTSFTSGVGGAFSGTRYGINAFVSVDTNVAGTNTSAGGFFFCNSSTFAYCGARINGTNYKITGTGTAGTFVRDLNNQYRIMACPEAPEILFQDYGIGQLTNGEAIITLDPILSKNIIVDAAHPLRVFIQPEDDCNGVFVTEKSQTGFKVKELAHGTTDAKFAWSIVANRADEKDFNGNVVSINANNRFVPAPPLEKMVRKPHTTNLKVETVMDPPVTKTLHSIK